MQGIHWSTVENQRLLKTCSQDRGPRDSNMRAYQHSMRSRHRDRLHRPSFAEAAERRLAEAVAAAGSSPAEADHRRPAEEGEGSNPAGADHRSRPVGGSPAVGGIL